LPIYPVGRLLKSAIANRKPKINGGKGIRTPDFQLAKLALYQLSYAPEGIAEFRLPNFDCKEEKKMPDVDPTNRHPTFVRFERSRALEAALFCSLIVPRQALPNMQLTRR
jgi:hypothetical protein